MALAYQGLTDSAGVTDAAQFRRCFDYVSANISRVVVAPSDTIHLALLGLVADGHVLVEDKPGVGKTLLAKCIAQSIEGAFTRVQFTPDLVPSDITGANFFNPQEGRFDFLAGPVFTNVLLADELNRTNPRTQAALLEAMAERQVSSDGVTRPLPRPFMVIATQNSSDSSGTFPLPDTELDRFLVRISIGFPSNEAEMEILVRSQQAIPEVTPVLTTAEVVAMQDFVCSVQVARSVKEYIINLVSFLREYPAVRGGVSPRGTVLLQRASQGWAASQGRDFVIPEDVKAVADSVLVHRIVTDNRESNLAQSIVEEALDHIPVPL